MLCETIPWSGNAAPSLKNSQGIALEPGNPKGNTQGAGGSCDIGGSAGTSCLWGIPALGLGQVLFHAHPEVLLLLHPGDPRELKEKQEKPSVPPKPALGLLREQIPAG